MLAAPSPSARPATAALRTAIDLMIYAPDRHQGLLAAGSICRLCDTLMANWPPHYTEPASMTTLLAAACTSGTWSPHWYRSIDDQAIAIVHRTLDALHKVSVRVSGSDDLFDVKRFVVRSVDYLNPYTITWLIDKGYDLSPAAIGFDVVELLAERSGDTGSHAGGSPSMFGEVSTAVSRYRNTRHTQ